MNPVKKLIEWFNRKHRGAANAHRIMVLPDTLIREPSYTIEEALRVRNSPNHPINATSLRVHVPTLGEITSH
jgi:hypothetical protein